MTSADDNFGQTSTNSPSTNTISVSSSNQPNHTYHRRNPNHSNHPYANPAGVELRLLMTFRDAGAVIGKGGSAIQKLRADFPRTIIQVPDCASPERILIINGDPDQCYEALYQIIPVLTDSARLSAFNRRRNQTNQIESNANDKSDSNENPVEIRLLVHQIYCGAIIGKGGQQVKELRQTHNLDIKVFSVCCPMSHERVIALRGKINDVIECIRHIYSLISASTHQLRGGPLIPYDPHNFDVYAVNEYGGFAASGNMDNRLGYNPRTPYIPASAGAGAPRGGVGVYPIQSLAPLVDVPFGGGPGLGARYPNPAALITATRVTLPNELVGAIIGPRGSKIQQIRQITQANIIIDDQSIPNASGGGDRIITIEGLPEQISRAQALLQQAVRQSGLWRP